MRVAGQDLKCCPECKSNDVSLYRILGSRSGFGKCLACDFFVPLEGYIWKKLARQWNEIEREE